MYKNVSTFVQFLGQKSKKDLKFKHPEYAIQEGYDEPDDGHNYYGGH
jgi:hypothetical protein